MTQPAGGCTWGFGKEQKATFAMFAANKTWFPTRLWILYLSFSIFLIWSKTDISTIPDSGNRAQHFPLLFSCWKSTFYWYFTLEPVAISLVRLSHFEPLHPVRYGASLPTSPLQYKLGLSCLTHKSVPYWALKHWDTAKSLLYKNCDVYYWYVIIVLFLLTTKSPSPH